MYDQETIAKLVSAHHQMQRIKVSDPDADGVRLTLVKALKESQPQFAGLHLAQALSQIILQLEGDCGWLRISASWALAAWLGQARDWLQHGQFFDYSVRSG